tara:strand:+ start:364 stop:495 length:132 start_codon:yes stop_codon:yes gene_type:complete
MDSEQIGKRKTINSLSAQSALSVNQRIARDEKYQQKADESNPF